MLDIKFIRENPEKVKKASSDKGITVDIDAFLNLDKELRVLQQEIDGLRSEKNKLGKADIEKGRELKEKLKGLEESFSDTDKKRHNLHRRIPNIPFDDVLVGKDDAENIVLRQVGKLPKFGFTPKEHFLLGEELDIIDLERAAKISGSRFYFLKNEAVILETALINFTFSLLAKKGFVPVIPPVMIKPAESEAMGYIENHPDEEAYYLERDELYLTATSEQSLGAMHSKEILDLKKAKKYVAFSTCFRRESGSYGKDTKGIFRVHQFDKMEMFIFCKPEESEKYHKELLSIEEELMKALDIPYQVINICTGDLGKPAAKKYDIEAWMPGQSRYRETHSTSNCTDYQSRGLEIRYKENDNSLKFIHTLNGTAFAMGRIIVAILENYQQKDGSVKVPKVLQKYTGFKVIKKK
ncbi:MAG: serine--tRNA ligase [Candidatus Staskawiczbacteria bacterium]|nr:serine--tRNA ligase [Candidatus Staskawiczbacteria bacterium]